MNLNLVGIFRKILQKRILPHCSKAETKVAPELTVETKKTTKEPC